METDLRPSEEHELRCLLDRIADRWTVLVMGHLGDGPLRFSVLQRRVGDVSAKVLTQVLRGLERDGLVERRVFAEVPPRVEYSLTPLGRSLCGPLGELRSWAEAHREAVASARTAYDTRARGTE